MYENENSIFLLAIKPWAALRRIGGGEHGNKRDGWNAVHSSTHPQGEDRQKPVAMA